MVRNLRLAAASTPQLNQFSNPCAMAITVNTRQQTTPRSPTLLFTNVLTLVLIVVLLTVVPMLPGLVMSRVLARGLDADRQSIR